jgi:UDP-N-acetylglucosamine transferase subunit ALG13
VIVAATGVQRALLQEEFASLTFVDLPGYHVKYGKNRAITILRLICSIPKILIRIKQERAWLRGFAAREGLDLVISDNRYGLAVPGIFCVFITHQLLIRTPFGRWTDLLLQRMNYRLIDRFSRCWIPDIGGGGSLAGQLSHPGRMPKVTTRYIGVLSRMEGQAASKVQEEDQTAPGGTDVLVLLSGPEPQRSLLEQRILKQARVLADRIVLVRGLPGGGKTLIDVPMTVTVHDHLPAAKLERLMAEARLVIARSGYSTVMDLARMGKSTVLIPTPGQTEQEYLGRYLAEKGRAVCIQQNKFNLDEALRIVPPKPVWSADDAGEQLRAELLSVIAQSRPSALG